MEDEVVLQRKSGILLQLSHTLNTTIISIKCHVFYQELNFNFQKIKICDVLHLSHSLCNSDGPARTYRRTAGPIINVIFFKFDFSEFVSKLNHNAVKIMMS